MDSYRRCTEPTYDPRVRLVVVSGCNPTHWNSTEFPFRRAWTPGTAVSDMSVACFWPCSSELVVRREVWVYDSVALMLLGLVGVVVSKSASTSRNVWIGLGMLFSVLFSVVVMGYATSKLWRNEMSYSGVGTLTAFQVLAGYVLNRTWAWIEEYAHWALMYVGAFAMLGLALGRGFIPDDVDPRAAAVLETVWVVACMGMITHGTPSVVVALAQAALVMALKSRLSKGGDSAEDEWRRMGEANTHVEVAKLMATTEFQRWMQKNHYRLRLLK